MPLRYAPKTTQRRPSPPPVETNDRTAIVVGLVAWVAALVTAIIADATTDFELPHTLLWACVAGIALGLLGLIWALRRRG